MDEDYDACGDDIGGGDEDDDEDDDMAVMMLMMVRMPMAVTMSLRMVAEIISTSCQPLCFPPRVALRPTQETLRRRAEGSGNDEPALAAAPGEKPRNWRPLSTLGCAERGMIL